MNSVEDLDVFKLAHQLALKAYSVTKTFPREELFSLAGQLRRAASSGGNESHGRSVASRQQGVSPIRRCRPRICRRGLLPITARQGLKLHFE
jgi:hypothetical protein